ncbi:MAG TPA: hypothetical protein VFQ80_02505, partial [Thermomicrobiales bacterium]|nr:hypothetical protein [Thermomicrobiales bacterium]
MMSTQISRRSLPAIGLAAAAEWSALGGPTSRASAADSTPAAATSEPDNLPPDVQVERIARTPKIQLEDGSSIVVSVARWRMAPQARFDSVFGGPVLVIVESGALTVEAAGSRVSAFSPTADARQANEGMTPIAGERLVLPTSGSAFAEDGNIGPIRNEASEVLSLLIVAVGSEPTAADMT